MSENEYDLKSLHLPRLAGPSLALVANLVENRLTRGLISKTLFENAGITWMRTLDIDDVPTPQPTPPPFKPVSEAPAFSQVFAELSSERPTLTGFNHNTVLDYAQAYRAGSVSPVEVADRALAAIEASNAHQPPLRAIIACHPEDVRAQALASEKRHQAGQSLGLLDGVPVAIKDEVDLAGFATYGGTSFLGTSIAQNDSFAVARLRAAGALLIGKANMHEIGIGVTGFNQHHGTARNPNNLQHHTGGSSSGPAAAVAAGLAPLALGADGGGSIRIPAGLCGLVGLKPTFGRVSEGGALPLCWSVAHIGPIGATPQDAAVGYAIMAGVDPADANTHSQPPLTLAGFNNHDLNDLTLGVYWPWFRHAAPEIVAACEAALQRLQDLGAQVREITLPELEPARVAHMILITSEMCDDLKESYETHHKEFSLEVRYDLAMARLFTPDDYLQAQRIRTRTIRHFEEAFTKVNLIITPTTAVTAPPIRPDAEKRGESDFNLLTEIMRFATPANLTGHPAISFPVGYDSAGLPIGMQAVGRYWEEHQLLRLANAYQQFFPCRKPALSYNLL